MGLGQFFGCYAEMKCTGIGDIEMVIIHSNGYSAAWDGVISMAKGIGQGFAGGSWRIERAVFPHHFPRYDPACNRDMVQEKRFGPAQ